MVAQTATKQQMTVMKQSEVVWTFCPTCMTRTDQVVEIKGDWKYYTCCECDVTEKKRN
jgi:hypothetical protein